MCQPTVEPVAGPTRALSLSGLSGLNTKNIIPRAPGSRGEHRAREAEEKNIGGALSGAEVPGLTQTNLKCREDKDPVRAALASVVSSLPPSENAPIPAFKEMANPSSAGIHWTPSWAPTVAKELTPAQHIRHKVFERVISPCGSEHRAQRRLLSVSLFCCFCAGCDLDPKALVLL